ncbi:MAG: hypothetical protein LPK13_10640 [Marinobacter sp.]|uniref:hypothetical protein n=1 Tax=Marinobacter sp. TaxID=50741 RepID=UPI0029C2F846|nr:hypothetical protein [Marinobacter sp.]MDX5336531.1 hypothetical protein [Marinobacter sp.]MDX5387655.1 hypothetical protein [Marinobacter sp.]MDX5439884.1 hypothetical protein [Alteromonadaceae bacterium]MDX5472976.1 hypothetical protein [Marinobacter sp.]
MPYKTLMATAVAVASVSGTAWLLSADNDGKFSWLPFGSHQDHQEANAAARDHTPQANEANASNAPAPSDNALGFMLASVADDYQRSARYPDYSVPLTTAQAEAYQGNRYHPVELPLEDDGRFIVTLDKFRFTQGEPILVVASLSGRQVFGDTLSATLESATKRDKADSADLPATEDSGYYLGTISSDHEPGEYRLIVEARVDGKPVRHVSSLSIEPDLGDFGGIDSPYVSGNDLVIPVRFDPDHAGYYALHSTGDLVTRHLLENQARWLQSEGLQPLKILAVMDLAGAGGGSSYGGITKPFIAGTDDGVVPTHSACGATTASGIDSCSNSISLAGKVSGQNGPSGLYYNHYPILMSEGANHSAVKDTQTGNISVPVVNNTVLNGLQIDFASRTYNQRAWWQLWGSGDQYVEVPNSNQTSMSNLLYTTLNN